MNVDYVCIVVNIVKLNKLIFFVIVSAAIACIAFVSLRSNDNESNDKNIVVTIEKVIEKNIENTISAVGTAVSNQGVIITAPVSKQVSGVFFNDGEFVEKGKLIVQLNDSQELAELKNLEASYQEQIRELNRLQPLHKAGVSSGREFEMQKTKYLTAEANLELIRTKVKELKIIAPFSGKLGLKNLSVGAFLSQGDTITTIDDISCVKADFQIPEKYALALSVNDEIYATSTSNPRELFKGRILAVSTRIDTGSRTVSVRGVFDNKDEKLMPGMSLKMNVVTNKRKTACVSEKSVFFSGDNAYIYIPYKKQTDTIHAKKTKVILGQRRDGYVEINDGISAGEDYICEGLEKIKEGAKISIRKQ